MASKSRLLLAGAVFLFAVVGGVAFLIDRLQTRAFEKEARTRVEMVIRFSKACRTYTKKVLRPAVQKQTDEMVFEAMSSTFVTKSIFENFTESLPGYSYKQATLNPLNLDSKANESETKILEAFIADPKLEEMAGYRIIDGQEKYYVARPIVVEQNCLKCHGDPDAAPPEVVKKYGRTHGYFWKVGEPVSALIVAVPTRDLLAHQAALRNTVLGVFAALAVLLISVSLILFSKLVSARLRAEFASRSKSEFLANMSHEIRTPMTAILGFLDVLVNKMTNKDDLEKAGIIKRNGEHLLAIINDILDLAKIDAGKTDVERIKCSPVGMLAEVTSLMRVRAAGEGLTLEVKYEKSIPESIQSDPTRLRQILINLAGNAIKFTQTGNVKLVARLLHKKGIEPQLQIDVVDSGIGMSEEDLSRLFQPFEQADASTSRRFGGTGLGLTISKRLAIILGGDITATSVPGKGSTFTVTVPTGSLYGVPMLENPSEISQHLPEASSDSSSEPIQLSSRVLLAEDGPDNQKLVSFLLRKAGAEVAIAENGQVAVDMATAACLEGNPFDVILMDMQMPVLDGYEATKTLRSQEYQGAIIALTAHAMHEDRLKCLDAGCDDYLSKPADRDKLIAMVDQFSRQNTAAPSA